MKKIILLFIIFFTIFSWINPNHIVPWLASHSEFSIFLSLILLLVYTIFSYKYFVLNRNNIIFIIIACLPLIQFSINKVYFLGDAFIVSIYILGYLLALILGNTLGQNELEKNYTFQLLCWLVLMSAIFSVYIALMQWLMIHLHDSLMIDLRPGGRPYANFAQPNNLATFLTMAVLASCYLYEAKKYNQYIFALICAFLIFGIVLTQSRTPWVFAIAFAIWWYWKSAKTQLSIQNSWVICAYGYFLLCVILLPIFSNWLGVSFLEDPLTRATTGLNRLNMWQQMWVAIQNEPWFGYGWNQVSVAQVQTTLQFSHHEWTEHTHNFILDVLVWNGLLVGILILIGLIVWLWKFVEHAYSAENFLMLAMVGAVLVHAMLEYPLDYAFFLLPVGFILGLIQENNKGTHNFNISRFTGVGILILCLGLYVVIFNDYRKIEKDMELARFESLNIGTLSSKNKFPDVILLTQLKAQIGLIRTQPREHMSEIEITEVKEATYRHASSSALYRYAQVLALNGQEKSAQDHLDILEKMHGKKYSLPSLYDVQPTLAFEWMNSGASK
ncbi:PglL family O-oligosaccharyltransferase [Acinetobacter schindleri]|uniref:PglL family O-oligosaccharyltransferase n=1 Tax=Acinetobacter schindleri TaxID=108981 RepID=UPI000972E866|nr:O-antigen ligase family protein [Acinetobacter schindleri]APX63940.1 O-antigen ligase-related protein [Acinetobacter schindleri]